MCYINKVALTTYLENEEYKNNIEYRIFFLDVVDLFIAASTVAPHRNIAFRRNSLAKDFWYHYTCYFALATYKDITCLKASYIKFSQYQGYKSLHVCVSTVQ